MSSFITLFVFISVSLQNNVKYKRLTDEKKLSLVVVL